MTYTSTTAPQAPQQEPTKTVVFGGRVTKDPELRMTPNNQPVINVDFAVNQLNGETHWGRATIWGTDAYIAADFCKKGDMIAGVADFKVTSREHNGQTYQNNEYNVQSLFLSTKDILAIVDSKIDAAVKPQPQVAPTPQPQPQAPAQPAQQPTGFTQPAPADKPQEEFPDLNLGDDLPF